jgi:F-type H+-transporting ATPase subunit a
MINIFSSFDPSSIINPLFISQIIIIMIILPIIGKIKTFKNIISKKLIKEVLPRMSSKNQKRRMKKIISLFFFFSVINLTGLTPSSFSFTTQISLNLPIALILWISINIFRLIKKKEIIISHIVPITTPIILAPFIVIIELVRNLIRPITLSVRITANIVAGHILISLVERFSLKTKPNLIIGIIITSILTILEIGVAIIQAYVFMILIRIYLSEFH